ncbi:CobW family GTP-binding protein [Marinobacterium mangrovicola]|uniref:G3E family GTPase n=1 Tax=Marinobacterium mangrovicola TaxID=1476959 RepID=A0A4R1HB68_9GAMM|nr:CobW family GTP-binding protein [Marinobacterium mangrovicola]TCK16409.1 G3E family GTPase [Marinobacterium mangrovicola]
MQPELNEGCEPIPMTVLSGFLGAGKTTYLNQLIHSRRIPNALIMVNDFGDINIDSELIDYQNDRIINLTNGCVCCTLGGSLAEQLAEALRFTPRPSAIVIEASGVANPARIADIARVSHELFLKEVICVVDASQALVNAKHPQIGEIWREQIAVADRLLLNRLVDEAEFVKSLDTLLNSLNPSAARLELPLPNGAPAPTPASQSTHTAPTSTKNSHSWASATLTLLCAIDAERLTSLLKNYADVVIRAKGFLVCGDQSRPKLLQFSGGQVRWLPSVKPPAQAQLVLIGIPGKRFDEACSAIRSLGDL